MIQTIWCEIGIPRVAGWVVYDSVPPLDKVSAHPDHIYGIKFMNIYLCAEWRLREYLQEQTFGHAFTCAKLYIGVHLHCSNSSFDSYFHLSNCYLTKLEAAYITWVVSFCAFVPIYFELTVWGSIQEAKYTVIYSPCHSWNSNLTSNPSDPCEIINYA